MWGVKGFQTKPYKPKRCPKGIDGWRPHQTGGLSNKHWPSDDHMALRALKAGGLTDRANEPFESFGPALPQSINLLSGGCW